MILGHLNLNYVRIKNFTLSIAGLDETLTPPRH